MAQLYVDENRASYDWEEAASDIEEGELVSRDVGGGTHPVDPVNDAKVAGIVPHLSRGDHIAEHEYDFSSDVGLYVASQGDDVPIAPTEEMAVYYPKTVKEANTTDPAPSVQRNADMVVVDLGNGPVVVEEGYTDNGGTVYGSSGTGDYIEFGEADKGPVSTKGERVAVRVPHSQ